MAPRADEPRIIVNEQRAARRGSALRAIDECVPARTTSGLCAAARRAVGRFEASCAERVAARKSIARWICWRRSLLNGQSYSLRAEPRNCESTLQSAHAQPSGYVIVQSPLARMWTCPRTGRRRRDSWASRSPRTGRRRSRTARAARGRAPHRPHPGWRRARRELVRAGSPQIASSGFGSGRSSLGVR
jgi:hypothetical protein